MNGGTGEALSLIALAGVGVATGGLGFAALPAATGGFSIAGAIGGAAAAFTAGSALMQGSAEAHAQQAKAAQTQLQMSADQAQAAVEEEQRQRQLRSVLSTQRAIFGSSNIDLSSGVVATLGQQALGAVNTNSRLAALNADINEAQGLGSIQQDGDAADAARTTSYVKASGSLLTFAGQRYNSTTTIKK